MTNLESLLESRDTTLCTEVCIVKAMIFPVVMCRYESWTVKKAEHWELILLNCGAKKTFAESPLDCKETKPVSPKGNQSWISLEGLMLNLKLQYFGHLLKRANSLEKTLMLENIEGRRRRGWQRMRWLGGIIDSMDMSLSRLQEFLKDWEAWHAAVHRVPKSWTWLSDNSKNNMHISILSHTFISKTLAYSANFHI